MEHLTESEAVKRAAQEINDLLDEHSEWFYVVDAVSRPVSLRRSECDVRIENQRLIFSCWDNEGARVWRIRGWERTGDKILLEATQRMGAVRAQLELIPRARTSDINALVRNARHNECARLAQMACEQLCPGAKVERATLSRGVGRTSPGKYARIVLKRARERILITSPLAEESAQNVDEFLASALLWLTRVKERITRPPFVSQMWLIAPKKLADSMRERLALLREELRESIRLYEHDEETQSLNLMQCASLTELLSGTTKNFHVFKQAPLSESAEWIISQAPEAIDVVCSRHGETLRFHGLSFARVRRVMNREQVWFGTENAPRRRLLDEGTWDEWIKLLADLMEHRRAEVLDAQHALYRAAPEAWLESILRRDITQLDPGLIISPLHAQFRAAHGSTAGRARPIDLLALRRDGRLVVIELKVSEDREHVLQGADYWRRIATHHRAGHIKRARLFDDAEFSDDPPLVYLVAPMLRFHRSFNMLAHCITPEIEIYRFDINEDWRAGVNVVRRARVNLV